MYKYEDEHEHEDGGIQVHVHDEYLSIIHEQAYE